MGKGQSAFSCKLCCAHPEGFLVETEECPMYAHVMEAKAECTGEFSRDIPAVVSVSDQPCFVASPYDFGLENAALGPDIGDESEDGNPSMDGVIVLESTSIDFRSCQESVYGTSADVPAALCSISDKDIHVHSDDVTVAMSPAEEAHDDCREPDRSLVCGALHRHYTRQVHIELLWE